MGVSEKAWHLPWHVQEDASHHGLAPGNQACQWLWVSLMLTSKSWSTCMTRTQPCTALSPGICLLSILRTLLPMETSAQWAGHF